MMIINIVTIVKKHFKINNDDIIITISVNSNYCLLMVDLLTNNFMLDWFNYKDEFITDLLYTKLGDSLFTIFFTKDYCINNK